MLQMSDERLNNAENWLDRVEALLLSTGNYLQQAAALAQENTRAIDRLTIRIDSLSIRIDNLAAASERHDRILDYLLNQREGEGSGQN